MSEQKTLECLEIRKHETAFKCPECKLLLHFKPVRCGACDYPGSRFIALKGRMVTYKPEPWSWKAVVCGWGVAIEFIADNQNCNLILAP